MDTVAVVVRENNGQQVGQFLAVGLLGVESSGFAVEVLVDGLHDVLQGALVGVGEKANLAQRANTVVLKDRVFLAGNQVLHDGTAFGLRHQFTQIRLAGNH